ncbi:GntR family transcriptional regulator [Streptomyces sp. NBC_01012]|uniref:GntR family transcriptional regulator n=1 Tax=Streptomyces sp. NBC_01012 TaxID=2903717 RepID=UPI002F91478D|nr:GntR family transcriptional regulator [Streptomyces sp. NBC_01012]
MESFSGQVGRRIPQEWTSSRPRAQRALELADRLRRRIGAGDFDEGVPEEIALAAEMGASRNAVREALGLLREEGLIVRRRGVGTSVVRPQYGHGLDRLAGLAEILADSGTVTNEVLAAEVVAEVPEPFAARLNLPAGVPAVYIERVRRLNGMPLSLDITYLTGDIGAAVLDGDLAGRDVFALIEEATGAPLGHAELTVHAANANTDVAAVLDIPPGTAIFTIERLTHLADGRPVDAETLHIRADRMALHATVHRGRTTRSS